MTGIFIAVVGPSGAGKDSLIAGALARRPDLVRARRVITRPADAGDEDHEAVTESAFAVMAGAAAFALSWQAHGLSYGIPASIHRDLSVGRHVLANISRTMLAKADAAFPAIRTIWVMAPPAVLAERLAGRGRETPERIAARLARQAAAPPAGATVIDNGGSLEAGVVAFLAALPQPQSG